LTTRATSVTTPPTPTAAQQPDGRHAAGVGGLELGVLRQPAARHQDGEDDRQRQRQVQEPRQLEDHRRATVAALGVVLDEEARQHAEQVDRQQQAERRDAEQVEAGDLAHQVAAQARRHAPSVPVAVRTAALGYASVMGNRTVRLAAVQPRWRAEDYATAEAFARRVRDLAARAVAGAPGPALVAFPELWALPLLATAAASAGASTTGLWAAAANSAAATRHALDGAALRRRWRWSSAAYADLGVAAFALWTEAFAEAARATGATLVAGSGFFPTVAYEAARGLHVVDADRTTSRWCSRPRGAVVARAPKVFLTEGLERRVGLARGRVEDLPVVDTPVGRVAVAVCLDGWYHHVLERLDGLGAQVLVQPSANAADLDPAVAARPQRRRGRGVARARPAGRAGGPREPALRRQPDAGRRPAAARARGALDGRRAPSRRRPAARRRGLDRGARDPGIASGATEEDVVVADVPHPGRARLKAGPRGRSRRRAGIRRRLDRARQLRLRGWLSPLLAWRT
jgi:predicted amidohydrolase